MTPSRNDAGKSYRSFENSIRHLVQMNQKKGRSINNNLDKIPESLQKVLCLPNFEAKRQSWSRNEFCSNMAVCIYASEIQV